MSRIKPAINFLSATFVKIVVGLFVIKFLAWKIGPDGFGLLGQLMTFVAITGMVAGGGIGSGLIRALSRAPVSKKNGQAWLSTAYSYAAFFGIVMALSLGIFATFLSQSIFDGKFKGVIIFLAVSHMIVAFGMLIQAEASSRNDSGMFARINIIGTLLGASALVTGVALYGIEGAGFGVALMPVITGMVGLYFFLTCRRALLEFCKIKFDPIRVRFLFSFSILTLVGAVSVPVAQIFIRNAIGQNLGWHQVGLWQGVIKVSDVYMQFIGVVLINYALPRFAALVDNRQSLKELRLILFWLVGALIMALLLLYTCRIWIIRLLFSEEFLPMSEYFLPQMGGDVLRTVAASISFYFISKGFLKVAFFFEAVQGIFLLSMFKAFEHSAGSMAPYYAHLSAYLILSIVMLFMLRLLVKVRR